MNNDTVISNYAMKLAESNMKDAKKFSEDETKTPEEKTEKLDQAQREINAANALSKGDIGGAFSCLSYFRDR